ncbi:MAG: hypothetical protein KC776_19320 [Myxococcales bacterium]|nr:hypothetical protein [Myxococcales bacterium]MCB9576172.1 hypothetical protein [Polyangiaceae bacterium]
MHRSIFWGVVSVMVLTSACGSDDSEGGSGGSSNTGGSGGAAGGSTGGNSGTGGSAGGGTGGSGGGGTGGMAGSGGSAGGGTGGAAGAAGSAGSGPNDCESCIGQHCATEFAACNGDTDCAAIITCIQGCQTNPSAGCEDACVTSNPNGKAKFDTLSGCIGTNCSTVCK